MKSWCIALKTWDEARREVLHLLARTRELSKDNSLRQNRRSSMAIQFRLVHVDVFYFFAHGHPVPTRPRGSSGSSMFIQDVPSYLFDSPINSLSSSNRLCPSLIAWETL